MAALRMERELEEREREREREGRGGRAIPVREIRS